MAIFRSARILLSLLVGLMLAPGLAGAESLQSLATGAMANFIVSEAPKPAPEIHFVDAEGGRVSLADFEGKVVLLNFWATWCAPCLREMPDIDALQREFGPDGFVVVAVSGDRQGPSVIQPFYDRVGITDLAIYNDRTMRAQRAFRVYGLPTTVLVDRRGREVARLLGPAEWGSPEAKALIRHLVDPTTTALKQ